ncbi:hypothetical protein VH571_10295 [Frondihabitans sp. 4ASC-45]|uniref:hypothetical protein n=1 Tax=Frondihabitans sp. 4ASC-45 TaxID=3111636 RepID=UPI003C1E797C
MTRNAFGIPISDSLCPDCNAELRMVEISPNVTVAQILHDDTCPALAAAEGGSK